MATNPEPDSFILFDPIYNEDRDLRNNQNVTFDFQVTYHLYPEEYSSDGEEEEEDFDNLETRTVDQTHEFDKEWLIGGDRDQIENNVYHILDLIQTPFYWQVVRKLTDEIMVLKEENNVLSPPLLNLERVEVTIDFLVRSFPHELDGDHHVDVTLAVAPASDEAVEQHFETVVVEDEESYCVLCMDKIRVGSDVAAGRMPCLHVFHRTCGEAWLRNSGICPLCRAVFPS